MHGIGVGLLRLLGLSPRRPKPYDPPRFPLIRRVASNGTECDTYPVGHVYANREDVVREAFEAIEAKFPLHYSNVWIDPVVTLDIAGEHQTQLAACRYCGTHPGKDKSCQNCGAPT